MTEVEWLRTFGENLRSMIVEYRMSQRELAELTGLSEASISYYLRGEKMPGIKTIINMAYVFGCSTDDLIDFGSEIR